MNYVYDKVYTQEIKQNYNKFYYQIFFTDILRN